MEYKFYTLDVFTDKAFTGNQLAVFPDGEGLDSTLMQKIAGEFNFSETVFVFPSSNDADCQLRIFTPTAEIPFAGHPTIGTAFLLTKIGYLPIQEGEFEIIFEEKVGNIPVKVKSLHNQPIYAELKASSAPEFNYDIPPISEIANLLSLSEQDITVTDYAIEGVSCGLPFLFIPLNSLTALQKVKINQPLWEKILSNSWNPHIYVFCAINENKWRSRMFAPALGIKEDPATGSAAVAFAAYLTSKKTELNGSWQWTIEQGIEMGRASLLQIFADKENGIIQNIRVGGASVLVSEGTLFF